MKILVVSYSLTGNNEALAERVAAACGGTHYRIVAAKPRTMGAIALDMLFGRTPKVSLPAELDQNWDAIVFAAPVWMGMIASPLRGCFRRLRGKVEKYAFVCLSGGADGPDSNSKLAQELEKRLGKAPSTVIDLHVTELLPPEPKPPREITSRYQVTDGDLRALTDKAIAVLRNAGISA